MAYDNRGHYFTNKLNGLFIRDLTRLGHHLSYYQFAVDSEKTISDLILKRTEFNATL